jgi:hypothetical protein
MLGVSPYWQFEAYKTLEFATPGEVMRKRMIGSILVLSLGGCAAGGEASPPTPSAGTAAAVARPTHGVAPTTEQAAAYRAELAKMMARAPNRAAALTPGAPCQASGQGLGSVALARYGANGQVDQACLDDMNDAMSFLTNVDAAGLEVK